MDIFLLKITHKFFNIVSISYILNKTEKSANLNATTICENTYRLSVFQVVECVTCQ